MRLPLRCALPLLLLSCDAQDPSANLTLFSQLCGGGTNGSESLALNLSDAAARSSQCSRVLSDCIQHREDGQCRQAARRTTPKLRHALRQITHSLLSLPPDVPEEVQGAITTTLLSLTSAVDQLVLQFGAVHNCSELEAAVASLCDEVLELATNVVGLVIPVVVLAAIAACSLVLCAGSCVCCVCYYCGVLRCCFRRRSGRRVHFHPRVSCLGGQGETFAASLILDPPPRPNSFRRGREKYMAMDMY
ncbi:hypothetical protein AB1Y20_002214 [Prymnesium parvum]|uniref:Uncharacterized protein n=1 Tax=Prymnesium parvum TaxID=97485 RepID=A0AB34J8H6_PRYPA